jgi:hypothetical protein
MSNQIKDLEITVSALTYFIGRADYEALGYSLPQVQQALRVAMLKHTQAEMEAK